MTLRIEKADIALVIIGPRESKRVFLIRSR